MEEIWKYIDGYEGLYQVSNLGRVKSLGNGNSNNSKERNLKAIKLRNGYLFINLYKEGNRKKFLVHRLVASAFIENPSNFKEVNHIDEDKTNNSVDNLEWCDTNYNINFGSRNERVSATLSNRNDLSKPVRCLETGVVYPSTCQAARQTGVNQASISHCCLGKSKTAGGYHWQYI